MQWHPEVKHSAHGQAVLENFLHKAAGIPADWNSGNVIAEQVERIRAQVGAGRVICGLSGGVDSAVAAALVHEAVGDQLVCVFVDHGLLRADEREQVEQDYVAATGVRLVTVDAREQFLDALAGVTDPEQKRKIIGREFIRTFEAAQADLVAEFAAEGDPIRFLVQGTLYPDVVESRRRHRHRQHQEPPQRRRPARRPAVRARRAAAHPLQGRGARDRPRARPARGDRRPPAVPRARPRHPHRRRGHARAARAAARRPTRSRAPS